MGATDTVELDGQYRLLREEAGLVDRSARGKLRVLGADAAEFLQGQLTNDVDALEAGGGCYAALLDRKGHMQSDMRVLRRGIGEFWIDTEPEALAVVARHLDTYRIGREVEVDDVTAERSLLSVIGPAAFELAGVPPLTREHDHLSVQRAGVEAVAVATDLGLDLICPPQDEAALIESLRADGIPEAGMAAAEILRVEAGRPRFGYEMGRETIPEEAGINERAISFTKGCYIGQETVARLHYKGKPNRRLRGLRLDGPAEHGASVTFEGRDIGRIGTAVLSPAEGPLALAILRREAEPGARVEVDGAGSADVVDVPFS
jgi:tRNA-modifying protein YgfZ